MLNQNLKEVNNNLKGEVDKKGLNTTEIIAGQVLWHNNNIESIKDSAERHGQSFDQELNEIIEETIMCEIEEVNQSIIKDAIMKDVKNLLIK